MDARGLLFYFFLATALVLGVLASTISHEIPTNLVKLSSFLLFVHPFPDPFGVYSYLPSCCLDQAIYFDGFWMPPLSIWCLVLAVCTGFSSRRMLVICASLFELEIGFWIIIVQRDVPFSSFSAIAPVYAFVFESPAAFFGYHELVDLALLLSTAVFSYLAFRRVAKVLQAISGALIPLPMMVLVWDRHDWTIHFTTPIIAAYTPWLTNEVLFCGCVTVFSLATVYDALWLRHVGQVMAAPGLEPKT